ncbi:Aste57867_4445 [Aphanomyces stellatus]|uniref:Aste57867_4445 protein n=1 Tax=Aphanomyces stellatus TaxID=120398 RepID=A0A485KBE7_9STRA|nr:hypothetical protein As57867_004433 [Aphanomyces stellatus]VFT81556.1 Aste57867_4445 [Aphanomyces stellatus]
MRKTIKIDELEVEMESKVSDPNTTNIGADTQLYQIVESQSDKELNASSQSKISTDAIESIQETSGDNDENIQSRDNQVLALSAQIQEKNQQMVLEMSSHGQQIESQMKRHSDDMSEIKQQLEAMTDIVKTSILPVQNNGIYVEKIIELLEWVADEVHVLLVVLTYVYRRGREIIYVAFDEIGPHVLSGLSEPLKQ